MEPDLVATALAVGVVSTGTAGAFAELALAFAADFGVFACSPSRFGFEVATFDGFADADAAAALAFAACDSAARTASFASTLAAFLRADRSAFSASRLAFATASFAASSAFAAFFSFLLRAIVHP